MSKQILPRTEIGSVKKTLKLLSYNIQVGIATHRPHHYVTRSWRHLLPHGRHFHNLDLIADVVKDYDIVGLQEVDAGSLRSSFVNQTEYLAEQGKFKYWYHQMNRNIGHIARHSNGLLSQFGPEEIIEHKLPGRVPGRGAILARFGNAGEPLVVVLLHLALSARARMQQLMYIGEVVSDYKHVVVMGDMNCQPHSAEMAALLEKTGLTAPVADLVTYPSWKPNRKLDHILVSDSIEVKEVRVLTEAMYSDHLPISMEVSIPGKVGL